MNKALKISLIVVVALIALAIASAFIAPYFLEDPLKKALRDEFDRQTELEYTLDFSDLHISLFNRSVSVDSILVEAGDQTPHVRKIEAASLSINGIKLLSLLDGSLPDFNAIIIKNPNVELLERSFSASSFSQNKDSAPDSTQTPDIAEFDLSIQNGSGRIVREDQTEIFTTNGLNLEASNVNLNALLDGSELLFVKNLKIDGTNLKWLLKDQLYEITAGDFSFAKNAESFTISDIALTPLLPKYEFSEAHGRQLDRIQLEIPEIKISGLQLDSLTSEHLELDTLQITNAWLEVFRDKYKERAPVEEAKPMLHEASQAIGFSFGLNTALVNNATIIYEEHKPPSDSTGSISFDNLYATLGPFHSAKHPRYYKDALQMNVETLFMNTGALEVNIRYPFFREDNAHSVKVALGSMDPKEVRDMLKNVGFVRIESGMVKSLEAEYELNNESSSGELTVLYQDLKVSFLNKENPEKEGVIQWAGDLFANTFVIESKNESGDPRTGNIDFEREKEKSIFAYWWKSLLSGLKDSIK